MAGRRDIRPNAFSKGILRTMRGSLKRFVALATITALGVTMLTGLRAACVDLRNSADAFFDEQSLFDVRVQSTLGLTDEDVAALAALDGVEAAEGGWSETAYTTVGSASEKVDVKALSPTGLNEPLVLEGRLPEASGEIAVTERYLKDSGNKIGDVVSFRGDDESDDAGDKDEGLDALDSGSTEVFERGEYTIVGSVLDPMEINAGEGTMSFRSSGGSQYSFFVVADEVIDPDVYTVAYVMVEGAEAPLCYSAEYEEIVDEVELSEVRSSGHLTGIFHCYDNSYRDKRLIRGEVGGTIKMALIQEPQRVQRWEGPIDVSGYLELRTDQGRLLLREPYREDTNGYLVKLIKRYGSSLRGVIVSPGDKFMRLVVNRKENGIAPTAGPVDGGEG